MTVGVSDVFHLRQIARAVIDFGRLAHANGSSGVVARVVEGLCTGARSSSTFARSELHRDERPADDLPARGASFVNGQVAVPAGGQLKVPTPRVDHLSFRAVPPRARAWRMR